MPKYYEFKVCGYYLYYTSHCVIEAMHVHASDRKFTETNSAKFFVKSNGETTVEDVGTLTQRGKQGKMVFHRSWRKKHWG